MSPQPEPARSSDFGDALRAGPIVADGAMGTQLYALGVDYDRCFDALCQSEPALVRRVHAAYVAAGAGLIETNTFGANALRLAAHGLADQVAAINEAGARIARDVADEAGSAAAGGRRVWVAGSVGPLGVTLAPVGVLRRREARAAFAEQIAALAKGGVDLILIETMTDLAEAREALAAARSVCALPVIVLTTFGEDARTQSGHTPEEVVTALEADGVDVVGANCSTGPGPMLDVVARMVACARVPVAAMPNAGLPQFAGDRFHYTASPAWLADQAEGMLAAGVRLVGGCCGTTPEHVAALARVAASERGAPQPPAFHRSEPGAPGSEPAGLVGPTMLEQALADGAFPVAVRVDPPRGFNTARLLPPLRALQQAGVADLFAVADSPRAQARMSALATSALLRGQMGAESLLHIGCRYRNRVATLSELLGAHALGVRDLLIEDGDLPASGDYPDATVVRDVTEEGLLRLLDGYNQGRDPEGRALEDATSFHLGCRIDFGAADPEREARRIHRLVAAGARFALSRPVFDVEDVIGLRRLLGGELPIPVLVGVLPLWDIRHAEYLHNEVPGCEIPGPLRERLADAPADDPGVGIAIAAELLRALVPLVAGVHLEAPFGRYEVLARVLGDAGVPRTGKVVAG
jgi:homocysteine S-methyltransferase